MSIEDIHNIAQLMELIDRVGFLPLLNSGISGFSAEDMVDEECRYVTHLQMACRIVTENFVYPHDKHGKRYGWGWSLLTTPEQLYGSEFCKCTRSPEESFELIKHQLKSVCTDATDKQILRMLR